MYGWYGKLNGYMCLNRKNNNGIQARVNQKAKRTKKKKQ